MSILSKLIGVKYIFAPHKRPGAYPGVYWQDENKDFTASITAHELTNDGKIQHNHLTIKTVVKDRESGKDRSRLHVTHGHDIAQIQVTEYADFVVLSRVILRGQDKKFYQITVDKNGKIVAVAVPHDQIQFSKD